MKNKENIRKRLRILFSIENNFICGEREILIVGIHLIRRNDFD